MDTLKRFDIDAYGEREYRDNGTFVQADDAAREVERLEKLSVEREAAVWSEVDDKMVEIERLDDELTQAMAVLAEAGSPEEEMPGDELLAVSVPERIRRLVKGLEARVRELEELVSDCEVALDAFAAPRENDGIPGKVSTWRRIELLGKLVSKYRGMLESVSGELVSVQQERDRLCKNLTVIKEIIAEYFSTHDLPRFLGQLNYQGVICD